MVGAIPGQIGSESAVVTILLQFFTGEFLDLALLFFALAIVAALIGARGVAGISMDIARLLVIAFLVLAVVALIL